MKCKTILATAVLLTFFVPPLSSKTKNRDRPIKGEWDFEPVKVWQINQAGEDVFGHPFSLRISERGKLYIFDTRNEINYIFDSEGNFIKQFAKRGQGPGEVSGQGRTFLVNDTVIISGMTGFHYFTSEGDYLRTARQTGSNLPPHLFLNEDELIAAPLTGYHTPEGKGKILLQNLKLGSEKVMTDFSSFEGGVGRSGEQLFDIVVIGLSPLLTIGQGHKKIYWGMSDSYLIHIADLEGNEVDSFSINRKPARISNRKKKEYFGRSDLPADALSQIINSFPNALTHFHRIEMHNGLIYVFVPELDMEARRARIRQVDIFSPEGKYLYRAKFELEEGLKLLFSPLENLVIQGNFMVSACELEDDTIVIVKHRIRLPEL
ncbi:MAG: 6-bladed beta-propeller [Candidatus Aminicenantes bacterium]|nr:6-bladed beta-propeller [Candidatus Aminicenantes bacterium]